MTARIVPPRSRLALPARCLPSSPSAMSYSAARNLPNFQRAMLIRPVGGRIVPEAGEMLLDVAAGHLSEDVRPTAAAEAPSQDAASV